MTYRFCPPVVSAKGMPKKTVLLWRSRNPSTVAWGSVTLGAPPTISLAGAGFVHSTPMQIPNSRLINPWSSPIVPNVWSNDGRMEGVGDVRILRFGDHICTTWSARVEQFYSQSDCKSFRDLVDQKGHCAHHVGGPFDRTLKNFSAGGSAARIRQMRGRTLVPNRPHGPVRRQLTTLLTVLPYRQHDIRAKNMVP